MKEIHREIEIEQPGIFPECNTCGYVRNRIGKKLQELDSLDFSKVAIVVSCSDHNYAEGLLATTLAVLVEKRNGEVFKKSAFCEVVFCQGIKADRGGRLFEEFLVFMKRAKNLSKDGNTTIENPDYESAIKGDGDKQGFIC